MSFEQYYEEDKQQVLLNKISILFDEYVNDFKTKPMYHWQDMIKRLEKDIKALM